MKQFPHYIQLGSMDCGPTCLRMIAKYYGRSYTLQNLRKKCFITLILIAQLVLSITQMGMGFIQNRISLHTNTRISISLISGFLTKLNKLPLRFFDVKHIGDMMQHISNHGRIQGFMKGP